MKVLIVEDEHLAVEQLKKYLIQYDPQISIEGTLGSVQETVSWLHRNKEKVDLMFLDIQLSDGLSFDIFEKVDIHQPIIFTTAFDEYAIEAFKVNSIDFLLKPISYEDFCQALRKLAHIKQQWQERTDLSQLIRKLAKPKWKERFVVKLRNHIHAVTTQNISSFYAEGRTVYLMTNAGKKFILDYKLEELEDMLDPQLFFRINRSVIISIDAIQDIVVYSNSRLQIELRVDVGKKMIVSREKVVLFKQWLGGNE